MFRSSEFLITFLIFLCLLIAKPSVAMEYYSNDETQPQDTSVYESIDINYNFIVSAFNGNIKDVLENLDKGAEINTTTDEGITALMFAAQTGNLKLVKLLVDKGALINIKPYSGMTALIGAVRTDKDSVAEYLIQKGADINETDNLGNTCLMYASAFGYTLMTDMLLYYHADFKKKNYLGQDALFISIYYGFNDIAQLLLNAGADSNSAENDGYTPLMTAAQFGDTTATKLLISYFADATIRNNKGFDALYYALANSKSDVAALLFKFGADANAQYPARLNPSEIVWHNNDLLNLIKENGGNLTHTLGVNQFLIGTNYSWTKNDNWLGFSFGVREKNTGVITTGGFVFRPSSRAVLVNQDNLFYQYWEKRYGFTLSASREWTLFHLNNNSSFAGAVGLEGLYSWGSYLGSRKMPADIYKPIPFAGISVNSSWAKLQFYYKYCDLKTYDIGKHCFGLQLMFTINRYGKKFRNYELNIN